MTTDTRTQTERMWDAAGDLDSARSHLMKAIAQLDQAHSQAVHHARNAVNVLDDAMAAITKEASK